VSRHVAGLELAGVVDAVGPNAALAGEGRAAAMTASHLDGRGSHSELVVVHESRRPLSPPARLVEAATLPMNGLTGESRTTRWLPPALPSR
jgi:NADPH:quinone reductase-like Zn-dependent oxidoreductase